MSTNGERPKLPLRPDSLRCELTANVTLSDAQAQADQQAELETTLKRIDDTDRRNNIHFFHRGPEQTPVIRHVVIEAATAEAPRSVAARPN